MGEALMAFCEHCFLTWGFIRIQALVLPQNSASLRLLERAGFQREGLLRKYEN